MAPLPQKYGKGKIIHSGVIASGPTKALSTLPERDLKSLVLMYII
jgi:hypothetical protein